MGQIVEHHLNTHCEQVSVVVLNWNQPKQTLAAIDSLAKSKNIKLNILLVDNGSAMSNRRDLFNNIEKFKQDNIARKASPIESITWIQSDKNLGYAGGCNLGLSEAQKLGNKFVIVFNNDLIVDLSCIAEMVKVALSSPKALVGARVMDRLGEADTFLGWQWPWMLMGLKKGCPENRMQLKNNLVLRSDYVEGSAILFSKQFLEIKKATDGYYFDPHYFLYCEDSDLCLWGKEEGYQSLIAWKAQVFHDGGGSFNDDRLGMRYYYLTRNRIRLANRWLKFWQKPFFHCYYLLSRLLFQFHIFKYSWAERVAVFAGLIDGYSGKGGRWIRHSD